MGDRRLQVLLAGWLALSAGAAACRSSQDRSDCPGPHATFRLTVRADGKPLPRDVKIEVKYGGGVELYDAAHPVATPQVVECRQELDEDAGEDASAGQLERIVCDLWTDGAASVTVTAEGYPKTERALAAETDECGVVMTEQEITLQEGDAGGR